MSFIDELKAQNEAKSKIDLSQFEALKNKVYTTFAEYNFERIKSTILDDAKKTTQRTFTGYSWLSMISFTFDGGCFALDEYSDYSGNAIFKFNGAASNIEEIEEAGYTYKYMLDESNVYYGIDFSPVFTHAKTNFFSSIFSRKVCASLNEITQLVVDKIIEMGKKDDIVITPCIAIKENDYAKPIYFDLNTPIPKKKTYHKTTIHLKYEFTY